MGDGYGVDPGALAETARGINDTIAELKTLGIDESAEVGRGFSDISLRGMQLGHQGLQESFDQFCERWSWGVRTLVQDGNQIAVRLGLSAGLYHDMEDYAVSALKDLVVDAGGNPHADDKQVEKQSWSQIAHDNAASPDFGAASWDKAGQQITAQWKAEARDAAEGPDGMGKQAADLLGYGQQFARTEDEVSGSAPKQPADS